MKDARKEKPGVLIYFDVRDPLEELDMAERGELFTAILNYGADGIEPTFENKLLRMAWAIVKRGLDRDDANYRTTMRKRKYAIYCRYEKEAGRTPLTFDEWNATQADDGEDSCIHMYTHEDTCIPTTTTTTTPTTTTTTTPSNIESAQPAEPAPSPRTKKFVKPTLEEVTEYVRQGGYQVDPERFHAYYESCGWTVKGRSMKDWKAAVRYWATSGTDRNRTGTRPEPQPAQQAQRKGSYFVPHGRAMSYAEYTASARPAEDDDDDDAAFEAMLKGGTT